MEGGLGWSREGARAGLRQEGKEGRKRAAPFS